MAGPRGQVICPRISSQRVVWKGESASLCPWRSSFVSGMKAPGRSCPERDRRCGRALSPSEERGNTPLLPQTARRAGQPTASRSSRRSDHHADRRASPSTSRPRGEGPSRMNAVSERHRPRSVSQGGPWPCGCPGRLTAAAGGPARSQTQRLSEAALRRGCRPAGPAPPASSAPAGAGAAPSGRKRR